MIEIPINTAGKAYVTLSCNVGENSVAFRFLWNERDGHWFCDFESANGKNNGIRIIPYSKLLDSKNNITNAGDFIVLKTIATNKSNLNFDTFGSIYRLYFITKEEYQIYFKGIL